MIKKFLRQLWGWVFLELDFEPIHGCSACDIDAVWKISRSVYVCGYHYPWGVNRAALLKEEIIIKYLKSPSPQLQKED